jgi:predicted dienelactone hydrolase
MTMLFFFFFFSALSRLFEALSEEGTRYYYDIVQSSYGRENASVEVEKIRVRYGRGRERTNALVACPVVGNDEEVVESLMPAMVYSPGFGSSCTSFTNENSTRLYDIQYPANYLDFLPKLVASHHIVFVCPEEPVAPVPGMENDEGAANLIKAARALLLYQPCEKFGVKVNASQLAVVGYSMGGGRAIRAASAATRAERGGGFFFRRRSSGEEEVSNPLFSALVALNPFNGFVNVKDVQIPSLLITGASDVVVRPFEVERIYEERIKSTKKALLILRDKSHEEAVASSASLAVGFVKHVFKTSFGAKEKEKQEQNVAASAAMTRILRRGDDDDDDDDEEEEDPSFESVRARGF